MLNGTDMDILISLDLPEDKVEKLGKVEEYLFGNLPPKYVKNRTVITRNNEFNGYLYAVIDAMQRSDIAVLLDAYETSWRCLWKGESAENLSHYAPYLVQLEPQHPFTKWLLKTGFGKNWGIFLQSYAEIDSVLEHLRKYNRVYDEENRRWMIFRYYAPITVRTFIPFLPRQDFSEFMEPFIHILSEDDTHPDKLLVI